MIDFQYHTPNTLEEVFDLFAIRIIIETPPELEKPDCWRIYSIVTDYYQPSPERLRDWVSTPRANGYESLHTTVMSPKGKWVEVQIRSERMDIIAEKGFAAHFKYKESKSNENKFDRWITDIRDLLESADENAIDFIHTVGNAFLGVPNAIWVPLRVVFSSCAPSSFACLDCRNRPTTRCA